MAVGVYRRLRNKNIYSNMSTNFTNLIVVTDYTFLYNKQKKSGQFLFKLKPSEAFLKRKQQDIGLVVNRF